MRVIHDGVTNKYFFEMNEKLITLVSLTPKQIYEEQLKLNKEKMVKMKLVYQGGLFLLTRFFLILLMMMLFFDLILIY